MMKILFILSLFIIHVLLPFDGFSQTFVIKSYTIEDGLPQTQVDDITQDGFGYLWVATRGGGLGKFDGKTFTTFKTKHGLPSNIITNILWSNNRKLWIGTYEGLSVYDGKKFKNYKLNNQDNRKIVTSIAEDEAGNIWVATLRGGVYKITHSGIIYYGSKGGFTDEVVRKIVYDRKGKKIWFCTVNDGLKYFSDNNFHSYLHQGHHDLPSVLTIHFDGDDIFFGTREGLYQKPVNRPIEKVSGINQVILEIKKDASGNLWLGTDTGIIRIHEGVVEVLDVSEGTAPVPVKKIFEDKEGLIWFSGDNLKTSSTMMFKKIDSSDGLSNATILSLNFDIEENLWLGMSGGGISRYSLADKKPKLTNYLPTESVVCSIVDDDGNLWFGSSSGIYKYEDEKLIGYHLQNINHYPIFETVFKDRDGNIWWGGLNNLVLYKKGIFTNLKLPKTENACIVRSFKQLKSGEILIGTNSGLFIYSNETITKSNVPELSHQYILNILEDDQGMVWMGLYGEGLLRWNPKDNSVGIYTEQDGLTSNLIYCIIFDDFGRLWAGTEKGIDFIDFDENFQIRHVKNFGKREGFLGIETNLNAMTKDKDGNIWIGTVKGVYTFNPKDIKINNISPKLSLTGIKLFHETPDWDKYSAKPDNWLGTPEYFKVPYNKNHLTFNFQAINFQNPHKVSYSYKLDNFDDKWSPPSGSMEAVYSNLPPGDYTFMVKSGNEDNVWNATPIKYSFTINDPIWARWWFYVLLVALFSLVSKFIYNYLVQRKLKRVLKIEKIKIEEAEKVRKIVAKDFHDEMGNHLASISILVQLLKRKTATPAFEVDEIVEKIDKSSRTLFNGTKNFIWSIDPKNDKLYEMLLYIKDFGEDLFDNTEINFYMDIHHLRNKNLKLPPGWSRHIVLIMKEALTNSLKHAKCKNVWVFVKLEGYNFRITIKDDGCGLCTETLKIKNSNIGLDNMRFRASKIKCKLGINKGENSGTELVLNGELPYSGVLKV